MSIWERNMEMWTKESIRKQMFAERRELGNHPFEEQKRNRELLSVVMEAEVFRDSDEIYLYSSYHHEAGTRELAERWLAAGKRLAFPRVAGKDMDFYWVSSMKELLPGTMGILEPDFECPRADAVYAPVLVPGVAFDEKGNRIGYGGGYYDRFFEKEPEHLKVGYAFDFQVFEEIPSEEHDGRMDQVITENGVRNC